MSGENENNRDSGTPSFSSVAIDSSSSESLSSVVGEQDSPVVLGVPRQRLAGTAGPDDPQTVASEPGDDSQACAGHDIEQADSLGVPLQRAADSVLVPVAQSVLLTQTAIINPTDDDELDLADWRPTPWRWRGIWYVGLIVVSLLGLIALSQVVSLLGQIAALPTAGRYTVYSALTVIGAVAGYAAIGLIRAYFRFKKTPAISVKVWQQLSERAAMRREANEAANAARTHLQTFLRDYAVDDSRQCRRELQRLRFEKHEITLLAGNRSDLLSGQSANASSEGWIKDFDMRFAAVLDAVAERRVEHYARVVGAATAVAPNNVVDTAIVVTNAMLMIRDLCCIYNLRTSRVGTALIGLRVFVNAFVAAELDDWSEEAVTGLSRLLKDTLGISISVAVPVVGQAIKGLSKRAAVCATNYLLCKRLGKATIRHLRPLQLK